MSGIDQLPQEKPAQGLDFGSANLSSCVHPKDVTMRLSSLGMECKVAGTH